MLTLGLLLLLQPQRPHTGAEFVSKAAGTVNVASSG
jgi:hypothetical protein